MSAKDKLEKALERLIDKVYEDVGHEEFMRRMEACDNVMEEVRMRHEKSTRRTTEDA